ncbi:hypothetical protein OBBRIDRAFT_822888 [Obba rivulosa]|uniref:DUF6534 domain-containing protein n=1 Tax=Obba rivulosa TaxID=1052685 RepID=A0A8E2J7Q2_9APHY|nr:hypothetical protein OBBRIDRAFT_822888 [Obba rivulosa]
MASITTTAGTLGATLIGVLFSAILYGVTSLHTFSYFKLNRTDPAYMKLAILTLWTLCTVHQAFVMHILYTYAVLDFGHLENLEIWSLVAQIPVTGLIRLIVKCLFCLQVWRLSGKKWYLMPTLAGIFLSTGEQGTITLRYAHQARRIASSIVFFKKGLTFDNFLSVARASWLLYVSFGCDAVSDILLSTTLVILLRNRRTGFRSTDSVIRSLSIYSVCIAVLTSFFSISCVIVYVTMPNTLAFMAIYFNLPGLLTNALLAGLNARVHLRQAVHSRGEIISIPIAIAHSLGAMVPRSASEAFQVVYHGDKSCQLPMDES